MLLGNCFRYEANCSILKYRKINQIYDANFTKFPCFQGTFKCTNIIVCNPKKFFF